MNEVIAVASRVTLVFAAPSPVTSSEERRSALTTTTRASSRVTTTIVLASHIDLETE